jgi:molecular chaperone DnaK (HSP70)
LGIDLGTTNSVCAYLKRGAPEVIAIRSRDSTSSVLAAGRRGELLVGEQAKARGELDPANVIYSVKRFVGRRFSSPEVRAVLERLQLPYQVEEGADGDVAIAFHGRSYSPTQLSSLILGRLKREAEDAAGVEFPRAVITVPAYFTERQVAATREAGRLAGFDVLRVLDEPTAAALAYDHDREDDSDQTVLVFDLGGGTFDISVLEMISGYVNVLNIEGDNLLGGDDFDDALAEWLLERVRVDEGVDLSGDRQARFLLKVAAEKAKIELSESLDAYVMLPALGPTHVTVDVTVTREQFEALIRDRIDVAIDRVGTALAGARRSPAEVDEVLLVGGSTAIPYVQERLARLFGPEKLRRHVHPMKSVALGAAIQGNYIPTVDCPGCATQNPVAADDCAECGQPLQPPVRAACPACFRYSDEDAQFCRACGADMHGRGPTLVVPTATCAHCGAPLPRTGLACDRCADGAAAGLRCNHCGRLNEPGSTTCAGCDRSTEEPMQVTGQDLGIELDDGRLSVILPKGTFFPTLEPVGSRFVTTRANEARMEIVVYQGSRSTAVENELCGYVTVSLPPQLPRGSPVHVAFGLDANRMITVRVDVLGVEREARLSRGDDDRLDPELQRLVETQRRKVEGFVARWSRELTDAELRGFDERTECLEAVLNGRGGRAEAEEAVERASQAVELASEVRGKDAFLSAVQRTVGKYIGRVETEQLARYSTMIDEARDRGDWLGADMHASEARTHVDRLGPHMLALVYCRTFAAQGSLSPSLSMDVQEAARRYDEAFDRGDRSGLDQARRALMDLWLNVVRPEVEGLPKGDHGPMRPGSAG